MPFFIYGNDAKTGVVAKRVYSDASTEADARTYAATMGIEVTHVIPCADQKTDAPAITSTPVPMRRTALGSASLQKQQKEEHAAFTQTLESLTPTAYITYALIAINVLVFLVMVVSGVSPTAPNASDLIVWGADFGIYTVHGQWWRVVTSMFIHIGVLHLFYNMAAFFYVGPTVERMFGNIGFLVLYFVSGIGGGLFALCLNPMQIHAGASGAIFGVYGALLAMLLRERDSIPPEVLAKLKRYVSVFIVYNLVNSLQPNISMSAHVGGLVTGFLCGLIAALPLDAEGVDGRAGRNMLVAGAGLLLCVIGVFSVHAKYPNLERMKDVLEQFDTVEAKTQRTFKSANDRNQQKQLTNAQFADSIDHDMLPPWRSVRTDFETLPPVKSNYIDVRRTYLRLRQEGLEAMSVALRGDDASKFSDAHEKTAKADKMSSWTK